MLTNVVSAWLRETDADADAMFTPDTIINTTARAKTTPTIITTANASLKPSPRMLTHPPNY
jgi:hypothetical protein